MFIFYFQYDVAENPDGIRVKLQAFLEKYVTSPDAVHHNAVIESVYSWFEDFINLHIFLGKDGNKHIKKIIHAFDPKKALKQDQLEEHYRDVYDDIADIFASLF